MIVASLRGEKREAATRAGSQGLGLLTVPINAKVVEALAGGATALSDLIVAVGSPPPTTMRENLRSLTRAGVVEKCRAPEFTGAAAYQLAERGRGLLEVAGFLATWLATAPAGPIRLGTPEAKNAVKALVDGWTSSMIRALAARPLTLTELDSVIATLSYPSLERRLTVMRRLGLLEAVLSRGRGTPYAVTAWLRRAIVPLAAATRWEHRHRSEEAPPITNRDVEAAFLLALPLLHLPVEASGVCRVAVQMSNRSPNGLVGAMVELEEGSVVSCVTNLEGRPDAWALGSTGAWFAAVAGGDIQRLEFGGDSGFAIELIEGMRRALLAVEAPRGVG